MASNTVKNGLIFCLILISGLGLGWFGNEYLREDASVVTYVDRLISVPVTIESAPDPHHSARAPLEVERFLQDKDYESAIQTFERMLAADDDNATEATRRMLLEYARVLINRKRYRDAEQFLSRFILASHRDVEVHTLLARSFEKQTRINEAINQIISARAYAYHATDIAALDHRLQGLVRRQAAKLREEGDLNALVALYQKLIQVEAQYRPYYFKLASAFEALGRYADASDTLALIQHDVTVASEVERRLELIDKRQQPLASEDDSRERDDEVIVSLSRRNNGFVVDVLLSDAHVAPLLIDTGATLTILTPDTLARVQRGYRTTDRQVVITTANGKVRAQVLTLDSLALGDWEVPNLEFCVLELGGDDRISGLLGMNFLSHFQFFIDQERSALHLRLTNN